MKRGHSELSCDSGWTSETYDLDTGLPRSQAAQASACSIFEYEPHMSPMPKYSSGVEQTGPSLFSPEERAAAMKKKKVRPGPGLNRLQTRLESK